MKDKLNLIKKVVTTILILEFAVIFVPLLTLVPVINSLFPEEFGSYGWIYSIFGIVAFVPTLVIYVVINHFWSKGSEESKQVGKVDRISNRIAWTLILGVLAFVVLAVTGLLD